jgi:hypothetical protein
VVLSKMLGEQQNHLPSRRKLADISSAIVKELAKFDLMLERSQSSSGGHAVQGRVGLNQEGRLFSDIDTYLVRHSHIQVRP